jgi:hypothetical protein
MKLTENTKVRVKVPKHLYEAIQAELDKKHGMDEAISGKAEELKDFYEKVKEQVDGGTDLDSAITFVMNDLGMEMMEEDSYGEDKPMEESEVLNEADHISLMQQIFANPMDTYEIVRMYLQQAPHEFGVLVAGLGTIATFLGGAAGVAIKDAINKIKSKKPEASEKPVAEELEETIDMETLLEAVNDAAKKKKMKVAKEKEVAAKKKAEDDKKKKEVEAKKKAVAAKKK